jgi:MFS family permease
MTAPYAPRRDASASPAVIALAGALCLSAAMGIGRFAFTPILPMMLHDGVIDLEGGSRLATANYLGYLLGALSCMALPALRRRIGPGFPGSAALVRFGLAITTLLTLAMVPTIPVLWAPLRFLAGYVTGIVFVCASGWCLGQLARLGRASLGGIIYTGPGIGIAVSGLAASAMASSGQSSATAWGVFGLLAGGLTLLTWRVFQGHDAPPPPSLPGRAGESGFYSAEQILFVLAYGLAGFGYIITATFLPVIAREALPGSTLSNYFWPVFGFGVIAGALMTRVVPLQIDRRLLLLGCYVIQGLGILLPLAWPTDAGFVAGSLLLGLPFTAITFFAMQEARRLRPAQATSLMGLLTAVYGIGQIAGPPMVAVLLGRAASHAAGFTLSLEVAAASLGLGALLYLLLYRAFPLPAGAAPK